MTKRQLTEDERTVAEKQLSRLKEANKYYKYKIEIGQLKVDKGFDMEAQNLKVLTKKEISEYKSLIKENDFAIKNVESMLINGIEEKEQGEKE